jgi:hypothetical protein
MEAIAVMEMVFGKTNLFLPQRSQSFSQSSQAFSEFKNEVI